jgi:hypothetical protein
MDIEGKSSLKLGGYRIVWFDFFNYGVWVLFELVF